EIEGSFPCQWCGGLHQRGKWAPPPPGAEVPVGVRWGAACPRVRKMEFHPNSNLVSIEFWGKWDESGVVFPEDAFDPGNNAEAPGGR
ncbi:MAG TPA: hypothetical protein VGS19_26905, partial [Streptosporangiaceae bacterium]|nr:hypothetical protein [Streptosporangiaceae bacterium]